MRRPLFTPADRPWLNLGLLLLTIGATFGTYHQRFATQDGYAGALLFSLSLVLILGAHEMGHYLLARAHAVETSLPYFIPAPLLGVGTLGAVIRIRSRIPTRNALVDIGAAGPLAGLVVALPVIALGLSRSQVVDSPPAPHWLLGPDSGLSLLSALFEWVARWVTDAAPVQGASASGAYLLYGDSLLMLGLQRLIIGPLGPGQEVLIDPLVMAGWFGLLVTLLNLLPVGQLDGGHLSFALFGERARLVGKATAGVLLALSLFASAAWVLWLLIASKVVGFGHPEVERPQEPMSRERRLVCWLCALALVGCAMPVPLRLVLVP
jgi:membrane-associated protease RseP (regulator of RpoE activity)